MVFQNFDINPPNVFTTDDAAIFITASNVLVQQNTIHNIRGKADILLGHLQ